MFVPGDRDGFWYHYTVTSLLVPSPSYIQKYSPIFKFSPLPELSIANTMQCIHAKHEREKGNFDFFILAGSSFGWQPNATIVSKK